MISIKPACSTRSSRCCSLPEVVDGSKWLNGEHYYADSEKQFVFMYEGSVAGMGLHYNTNLVDLKEFKSYWDLLVQSGKEKFCSSNGPASARRA